MLAQLDLSGIVRQSALGKCHLASLGTVNHLCNYSFWSNKHRYAFKPLVRNNICCCTFKFTTKLHIAYQKKVKNVAAARPFELKFVSKNCNSFKVYHQ